MDMSEEDGSGIDRFARQISCIEPVITAQNLSSVCRCPDEQMYRARIQGLFPLGWYDEDEAVREILIDMLHGAVLFASESTFTYIKAIIFLSLYVEVLKVALQHNYYDPKEIHKKYEELLMAHVVDRPPYSGRVFDLADVKVINEFFVNSFFRHLKTIINAFNGKCIAVRTMTFPLRVPLPVLPPLADMDMGGDREDESGAISAGDGSTRKDGKSPVRSPRGPAGSPQQAPIVERTQKPPVAAPAPVEPDVPEDKGPEVPLDVLRDSLAAMHERFVSDFEDKERQLIGKMKELEIRLQEKPQLKKPPPKKK